MRIGIIGSAGKMGQIRIQSLRKLGYEVLSWDCYDPSTDFIHNKTAYDILENPDIDVVFICTPNKFNAEYTKIALLSGKHVFCEKPPALTSSEVKEVKRIEEETNNILMYGFNHRHHASIEDMKNIILGGEYGKILWMRGRYGKSVDESFYNTWRANPKMSGGGILIDQGIHMLDLMNYFGGPFDLIHADVDNQFWHLSDIEDNVFAIMRNTKGGISAQFHSTMTQWRHIFSLEVFLENGYMVLNGLKTSSGMYGDEELTIAIKRTSAPAAKWPEEKKIVYTDDSFLTETEHFMWCVKNGYTPQIGNSNDALSAMEMVEKIYEFKNKNH